MNTLFENSLNLAFFLLDNKIRKSFNKTYIFHGKSEYYTNNTNYITYSQVAIIISQKEPSKIIIFNNFYISGESQDYKYDIYEKCLIITWSYLKSDKIHKIKIFKY